MIMCEEEWPFWGMDFVCRMILFFDERSIKMMMWEVFQSETLKYDKKDDFFSLQIFLIFYLELKK